MTGESRKKIERQYEYVRTAHLANRLFQELNNVIEPLFKFIEEQTNPESYDHFNRIRVLMPYVEASSQLEYGGNVQKLLEKLRVKNPRIIWSMFRHGLVHSIRPLNVTDENGITYTWAIPQYPVDEHYESGTSVGVVAQKLLDDLKKYIEPFLGKSGDTRFQTGIKYINPERSSNETRDNTP